MINNRLTILIFSCDAFSDLWESNIELLNKFWPDRGMRTCIVTDKPTDKIIPNTEIISAGEDAEFTDRLLFALSLVQTEYVFFTLDDYFLIKEVETSKIVSLVDLMDREGIDYLRLFLRSKNSIREQIGENKGICWIDSSCRYSVNLYVSIWRKSFMEKTVYERKNIWQYEVSLPRMARKIDAKCAMSHNKEFVILDVVRKGKILNKANRYLKKHDLYHGTRPVHTYWYEIKLGVKTWGARLAPKWVVESLRRVLIKRGHHFYSQDE